MSGVDAALVAAVKVYVERATHILNKVAKEPGAERLLAVKLADDGFDTAMHFAVAIQYAARALCPPAGRDVPPFPETLSLAVLLDLARDIAAQIEDISPRDLTDSVTHQAGLAKLTHPPDEYIARYAFPNMIFHLSMAYAGLRLGGMAIGKADFDGLHQY